MSHTYVVILSHRCTRTYVLHIGNTWLFVFCSRFVPEGRRFCAARRRVAAGTRYPNVRYSVIYTLSPCFYYLIGNRGPIRVPFLQYWVPLSPLTLPHYSGTLLDVFHALGSPALLVAATILRMADDLHMLWVDTVAAPTYMVDMLIVGY